MRAKLKNKMVCLSEAFIDTEVEFEGTAYVIEYLLDLGFTKKELVSLAFNKKEVKSLIEKLKQEKN